MSGPATANDRRPVVVVSVFVALGVLAVGAMAAAVIAGTALQPAPGPHGPLRADQPIRGWTILSDVETEAQAVIVAAPGYQINHLQLSHLIVQDLREIRESDRRAKVRRLVDVAARGRTDG